MKETVLGGTAFYPSSMHLDDLVLQISPWLQSEGKDGDVVVSCRVRLARNLSGFPFPVRAAEQDRRQICQDIQKITEELWNIEDFFVCQPKSLTQVDRDFLLERHIISQDVADSEHAHSVIIEKQERFYITVNEEDHIRISAAASGFSPQDVWEQVNQIDELLGSKLDYVFHEKYGFLTSCITNTGTGMKLDIMLHLPALAMIGEIDKVMRSLTKASLISRGLLGEGAHILGDIYLVSNRITTGKSEMELIAKMNDLIPQIADAERQARTFLMTNRHEIVADRCSRAFGAMRTARTISNVETIQHISSLRFGIHTGLLDNIGIETVNALQLHTQPAHLQKLQGGLMPQVDLDIARATLIRQRMEEQL